MPIQYLKKESIFDFLVSFLSLVVLKLYTSWTMVYKISSGKEAAKMHYITHPTSDQNRYFIAEKSTVISMPDCISAAVSQRLSATNRTLFSHA